MRVPPGLAAGVLLALVAPPLVGQATDPGAQVVKRAGAAYQALTSFQALFRQHFEDKSVELADSHGTLYQEGKNLFAMRFSDPPKDWIVADGTHLCVYTPSETPGQMMQFMLPNHPTYGTNLLGTFLDNAVERYRITYVKSETIDNHLTDVVTMEPLANDMQFRHATIWFDRENNMPRRLDIDEMKDHRRILYLSQIQVNPSILPATFQCKPPFGTKIVYQ